VYSFKLPQEPQFGQQLEEFRALGTQASQQLLERLWTDDWLETIAASRKKAYVVIGDHQVQLTVQDQPIYLPSRIRRGIAEQVGRILRSQARRMHCYYDILQVIQQTGVEGNLNSLVKAVGLTLARLSGKYYRWAVIRQILRTIRRHYYRLKLDLAILAQIPYTRMVQPVIKSFVFPYASDDGQAIKLTCQSASIGVQMKIPKISRPKTRYDWEWINFTLPIPSKILQRIQAAKSTLRRPTLRYLKLKGGLTIPFLDVAWTLEKEPDERLKRTRVLATDLGVINLTTSVICEAGSQISPPIFWSPEKKRLQKIEQLYHHLANLQRKLDRYPPHWIGQGRRLQERERLYRKLNRFRHEILHLASNYLLLTALNGQCGIIVLEDLRNYEPPRNQRKLSRKLSNWLRGALYDILLYKAKRAGITIHRVSPHWTSTYCPRCGLKGKKIREPIAQLAEKTGRFFACGHCGFTADRDYIGALNIYRMAQAQRKKRYSLKNATPVSYRGTGIPLNRPSGASAQPLLGG
jgi:IS605 OrfB family transposase